MDPSLFKIGGISTPATIGVEPFKIASTNDPFKSPTPTPAASSAPVAAPAVTKAATAPVDQSGFTPSGLFINSDGSVNLEKSLQNAKDKLAQIQKDAAKLATSQQPTVSNTSFVSSSDSVVAQEKKTATEIAQLSAPDPGIDAAKKASEEYTKLLQEQYDALEKRRQQEIDSINKSFDATKANTENEQKRETGTTNVALMRTGGYLGTQISGVGVLMNLAQTHRQELTALEAKRQAAINEANNAITDKQFSLARLKAEEVKNLDKEINDRRNKFFDQSMQIVQENRLKAAAEEDKIQKQFTRAKDTVDRIAPTLMEDIQSMTPDQARSYLLGAAKDLGLDPNLLIGGVNSLVQERQEKERTQVYQLASKYPSAAISPNDTFDVAQEKVRGSREYKLDIAKAEADLTNTRSLISQRASDAAIDYSSPLLKLYTQATGKIATSPSAARAVIGYANSILDGKEIVSDNYKGTLLDNQLSETDARRMVTDAFSKLSDAEIGDATVWQWLASDEAQGMSDEEKKANLMQAGKNPNDFGIY